jgi:glutamate-ammonia-ligase adenylyltransferase
LRVAAADVMGAFPLMVVSDHLTEIAEVVLAQVVRIAYQHLVAKHGRPQCLGEDKELYEPGFLVIAYGKLGRIELGYGSDLDLVFLQGNYNCGGHTDGDSVTDNVVFFARLGQRIIHIMTAHTPAGVLYEVDSRLRPSGDAGMLASDMNAFATYQETQAWTWEHQALVRARVVAGDAKLALRFDVVRSKTLSQQRDHAELQTQVREMRQKMRKNLSKSKPGMFDLKQDSGGIADIEFIVQYAVLRWAHQYPALLEWTDNVRLLQTLADEGLLVAEDAQLLADAYRAYRAAVHRLALQELDAVVEEQEFAEWRQGVTRIWHDLLETVK